MIIEGIVTTLDPDESVHIAPMGPEVEGDFAGLTLRPYPASQTYQNLRQTGAGVFHVCDDVELLARAAVGRLEQIPRLMTVPNVRGHILADACRWYAFQVLSSDESLPRVVLKCRVCTSGRLRDFVGFNRAKHAVVEAAILATRVKYLPASEIREQFQRLSVLVQKTGGAGASCI